MSAAISDPPAVFPAGRTAVLTRVMQVHLLSGSVSGCLVATDARLEVGTTAVLRVRIDGREYEDDVVIVRCQAVAGAGARCHVGARFLWIRPPGEGTLRHLLGRGEDPAADLAGATEDRPREVRLDD